MIYVKYMIFIVYDIHILVNYLYINIKEILINIKV